jgi:cell division protein FtsL
MSNKILLYVMVVSIPLALGLAAWQSAQYSALKTEVKRLLEQQEELVESNKRIITDIAVLSSSARLEKFAKSNLGFNKKKPEDVLQVRIEGGE